jgi:DNA-directed RNA polymerase specialized sigma24 family protein
VYTAAKRGEQIPEEAFSVEHVYEVIRKVVNKLMLHRAIPRREKEDTEQELIRKYLEKQDKIMNAFQGNANVNTYLTAILYRMACEVIRSDVKNWDHVRGEDPSGFFARKELSSTVENKMVIENEAAYLEKVLLLFDDETPRVILFLKVLFGIAVSAEDLKAYDAGYAKKGLDKLLAGKPYKRNKEAYAVLEEVVKRSEKRAVGADAIRIWLNKRMDQVIQRLNGTIQRSNYDRKSFRILFDYAYSKDY